MRLEISFIVNKKANKVQVKKAVEKTYNVNVTSVNTINVLGKSYLSLPRRVLLQAESLLIKKQLFN